MAQDRIGMDMPVWLLLKPDAHLSAVEREILNLAAVATSERVAAFMTDRADLTLVRHSRLLDL